MNAKEQRSAIDKALGAFVSPAVMQVLGAWFRAVTQEGRLITDKGVIETNNWGLLPCDKEGPDCVKEKTFNRLYRTFPSPETGLLAFWQELSKRPNAVEILSSGDANKVALLATEFYGFSGTGSEPEVASLLIDAAQEIAFELKEAPALAPGADSPDDMAAALLAATATQDFPELNNPQGWVGLLGWAWVASEWGLVQGQQTNNWGRIRVPRLAGGACPAASVDDGIGCVQTFLTPLEGVKALAAQIASSESALSAIKAGDLGALAAEILNAGLFSSEGATRGDWDVIAPELVQVVNRLKKQPGLKGANYSDLAFPPVGLLPLPFVDTAASLDEIATVERAKDPSEIPVGRLVFAGLAMAAIGFGATWALERSGVIKPA